MADYYLCTTSYSAWDEASARKWRSGLRQRWCTECTLWRWDDENCCGAKRLDTKAFRRLVKDSERAVAQERLQRAQAEVKRLK